MQDLTHGLPCQPASEASLPASATAELKGKHFAFVANSSWSIQQYRSGVIRTLLARGARVSIIAPTDRSSAILQSMGCEHHALNLLPRSANPLADWHCFTQLVSHYRRLRPDCIFHYTIKANIYGSLAARVCGVPCISVTTGLGFVFINNNLVARVGRALYRLAFQAPREVWFLNEEDRQEFLRRGLVAEERTFVLPSEGIDLDFYAPRPPRPDDGNFRFLLIARMLWDKGVGEYVEAAREIRRTHPHARFQLLGPADVQNPSAISRAQLHSWHDEGVIEYLGVTSDVRNAIAQADCVVLPSYREGVPRTLLEAAAMEKPIVATDVPGCREVVKDGVTGLLCAARNGLSLEKALRQMLGAGFDTRELMGRSGRVDVANRFDEQSVVEKYLKLAYQA